MGGKQIVSPGAIEQLNNNLTTKAYVQHEPLSLSAQASKSFTIEDLYANVPYLVMLSSANPGGWVYFGMYVKGSQYTGFVDAVAPKGVELSVNDSTMTVKNTSASYTLTGYVTIIH